MCCLFAMPPAGLARAEYREKLVFSDYEVSPKPPQSLMEAIAAASPFKRESGVFHGNTQSQITWSLQLHQKNGKQCAITQVLVEVESTITLPRLISSQANHHKAFAPYLEALRAHELGHLRINQTAAKNIEKALGALPPKPDCQLMQEEANSVGRSLVAESHLANDLYDQATQHGMSEGSLQSN